MSGPTLIVFAHIPKTAGMTLQLLLRRHFGVRHVDLPKGDSYSPEHLRRELRLNPFARSLASHALRPYVDFGELEGRLAWYTFLRDPVKRFISHYQHEVEKGGLTWSFEEWMERPQERHWRVRPRNWHVRMLAGEEDLEKAKQTLATKIRCVGLTERFDESLLLIRDRLQLRNLRVAYAKPRNPARTGAVRQKILDEYERYEERIIEHNKLDIALYEYAVNELYPRQVEEYGRERLQTDLEREFAQKGTRLPESLRYWGNTAYRRLWYLPARRCARVLAPRTTRC